MSLRLVLLAVALVCPAHRLIAQEYPDPTPDEVGAAAQYHLQFELAHPEQPLRAITIPLAGGEGKTYYYLRYRLKNVPLPAVDGSWERGKGSNKSFGDMVPSYPVYADLDIRATTDVVDVVQTARAIQSTHNRDVDRVPVKYHDVDDPWALFHIARKEGLHSLREVGDKLSRIGATMDTVTDAYGFLDLDQLKRFADQYPEFLTMDAPLLFGAGHLQGRYGFKFEMRNGKPVPDMSKPRVSRFRPEDLNERDEREIFTWWGDSLMVKNGDPMLAIKLDEQGQPVVVRDADGNPKVLTDSIGRPIPLVINGHKVPKLGSDGVKMINAAGDYVYQEAYEFEKEPLYQYKVETETIEVMQGYDISGDTPRETTVQQTIEVVEKLPTIMGGDSRWNTLECVAIFGATDRHWDEFTVEVRGLSGSVRIVDIQPKYQEDILTIKMRRSGDSYDRYEDLVRLHSIKWRRQPIQDIPPE